MPVNWCLTKCVWHAVGASLFQEKNVKLTCLTSPPSPLSLLLSLSSCGTPFSQTPNLQGQTKEKFKSPPPHFGNAFLVCNPTLRSPRKMFKLKTWLSFRGIRSSRATDLWGATTFDFICLLKACAGGGREAAERTKSEVYANIELLVNASEHRLFAKLHDLKRICNSHKPIANLHWEVHILSLLTGIFLFIYCLFSSPPAHLECQLQEGRGLASAFHYSHNA